MAAAKSTYCRGADTFWTHTYIPSTNAPPTFFLCALLAQCVETPSQKPLQPNRHDANTTMDHIGHAWSLVCSLVFCISRVPFINANMRRRLRMTMCFPDTKLRLLFVEPLLPPGEANTGLAAVVRPRVPGCFLFCDFFPQQLVGRCAPCCKHLGGWC